MAILMPDNDAYIQYVATGGQTVFPYDFPIESETYVVVLQTTGGVTSELILTTNYTVSGVGNQSGGNITLTAGATNGDIITIYRDEPVQRITNFNDAGDLLAEALNDQFNSIVAWGQQLERDSIRTVKLKPEDTSATLEIPVSTERASKFLAFDGSGNAIAAEGTISGSGVPVSAFGATLIDDANAAAARTTLGLGTLATVNTVATANITDDAVTNGKLANMPANTVKVNNTAGSSDPVDLAMGASSVIARGSSGNIIAAGLSSLAVEGTTLRPLGTLDLNNMIHVQDQKTSGTAGGGSTAGATVTRTLNTVLRNTITGASLSSNQVTLPAGTYYIDANAPAFGTNSHKAFLFNVTDAANALIGTNESILAADSGSTKSYVQGVITINATKVFELRHYTLATRVTAGLGINISQGTEIYSDFKAWKVA